jgi:hypothetical protein
MTNSKAEAMQKLEQTNSEKDVLTDVELEAVIGGSVMGDIGRTLGRMFSGNSDERRPTNQP